MDDHLLYLQGASISDDILPDFLSHDCRIIDVSAVQDADSPQTNCATIQATENKNSEIDQPTDEQQANKKIKTSPSEPIVHHYAFPQAAEEADKMDTIQSAAVKQEGSAESDGSDNQNRSLTVSDILNNLQASTEGGSDAPPPPKQRKKAKKKKPVVPEKPKRDWGILKHSFQFISAYEHYKIDRLLPDYHPEVTTKHFDEQGLNVDYIFSTGELKIITSTNQTHLAGQICHLITKLYLCVDTPQFFSVMVFERSQTRNIFKDSI